MESIGMSYRVNQQGGISVGYKGYTFNKRFQSDLFTEYCCTRANRQKCKARFVQRNADKNVYYSKILSLRNSIYTYFLL